MGSVLQDLRYAFRSLARQPGFALTVILCLGLGIGANATMFGVVDTLLLRPPAHVENADRLVRGYVTETFPAIGENTGDAFAYPDYVALRDEASAFEGVAAFNSGEASLGRGAEAEEVAATHVTHEFFSLLGVQPSLGRFFSADEAAPNSTQRVAVLSEELWRARYGGDPAVLGREIEVGPDIFTVVGVAPAGFTGVDLERVDLWLPMGTARSSFMGIDVFGSRNMIWLNLIGRLRADASSAMAEQQATTLYRAATAEEERADPNARFHFGPVLAARGPEGSQEATLSLWLSGVAAVVLLIACANVANLLLARGLGRQREIAVRLALGVRRGRLVRQLLTESLVLAALGGAAGLLIAIWGGGVIRLLLAPDIPALDSSLDLRMLAFCVLAVLATGVLCGVVPALSSSRPDLAVALKSGARESAAHRSKLRFSLQAGQVALSLVLLVGAGLFVRSLWNVRSLDLGMDLDRVIVAAADLSEHGYSPEEIDATTRRMLATVQALPGVERASIAVSTPFRFSFGQRLTLPGGDSIPRPSTGGPYINAVTPDFFATLGTSILRGRGFTDADREGAAPVAVVNEAMARLVWPGEEALGRCFHVGADTMPCTEVVGIAETARRNRLQEEPNPQFYVPLDQNMQLPPLNALFIRVSGDPDAMVSTVRRALQTLDPNLPYMDVRVMQELIAPQIRPWRMGATMFGVFGLVALLIAVVGLYGVLAYGVSQRTREIGVRMALGAQSADVTALVLRHALAIMLAGVVLGGVGAFAAGRALSSQLFGVSPTDPMVFVAVAAVLTCAGLVASYLPARRALRVDPMSSLRSD